MGSQKEVEIKFRVADGDLEALRQRLRDGGAGFQGKDHEFNLVFDDAEGRLHRAGELLRLRQDRRARLTFKSPIPDPRFKVRRELEVEVSDFDSMRVLLEGLGYRAVRQYEKERETWDLPGLTVLLDQLSFGTFVEMEGADAAIEEWAAALGFNLAEGITRDYLSLMDEAARLGEGESNL